MGKLSQFNPTKTQTAAGSDGMVFPRIAAMTEERWKAIDSADEAHQRPQIGHEQEKHQERRNGLLCAQMRCTCGWSGEWRKVIR